MRPITFFDTEVEPQSKRVLDIGAVNNDGSIFHSQSVNDFISFLQGVKYLCGHNILNHDLQYVDLKKHGQNHLQIIDTLYLSPLLFPTKPYHKLLKDDKLQTQELNNPVNDSFKAKDLFYDEINAFKQLDDEIQQIYYLLLSNKKEFCGFFDYIKFENIDKTVVDLIEEKFRDSFCTHTSIEKIVISNPIELSYVLALITSTDRYSITPPWVLKNYPEVESIMHILRNIPCLTGCGYCDAALDINKGLKDYFGFDGYRKFAGVPLQENAVHAAVNNKSLLAIFPTGGGKSLTFQIPALMSGRNSKGLTVIISPLQSLMKDQVDNLERNGITDAVTINGMLDPIERSQSFARVVDGSASLLYISPESLRSKTIERLLLGRNVVRFVIDEAHCFSSWGQDFRVDYLYIADFIKNLQTSKKLSMPIPVSCFTATAKQKVVEDIVRYFKDNLSLHLEVFKANIARTNLHYKVYESKDELEKYNNARALIESKNCPTIIYVSRTRKAYDLATRLSTDGFDAKPYHGKMDIKEKTQNQNDFIAGNIQLMVATSAFGMGVDKKDIGMVIHYEISDSLENYVQESGRAGRDENLSADCFVLFNEEDLSKHFILLNQTKLSVKEIQQIWRAIKDITKYRMSVSNSALEIARKAGWDDNVVEIETRVTTAIAALEQAGYLKRGQNVPRIFANSILSKNAQQAIETINASSRFNEKQKVSAIRIIKKLFSSKNTKHANDEVAESRIDYISDHLGIVKEQVIKVITLLREEKILADTKDLTAFIKQGEKRNQSLAIVKSYAQIEKFLLAQIPDYHDSERVYNIKELNEGAIKVNCTHSNPNKIKTLLNYWSVQNWIEYKNQRYSKNHVAIICCHEKDKLIQKLEKRLVLAEFIVNFMFAKTVDNTDKKSLETLIEFSVHELRDNYLKENSLFKIDVSIDDIENTLFYLTRISAIKIEGGFLVIYNKLTIDRLEKNNKIQYKKEDYKQLDQFYDSKVQQIHIVGEYAKKMLKDYADALGFVEDYFQLNYSSFLKKYFKGSRRDELSRNITPGRFKQLFGELSPRQLKIINDKQSQKILVAAGPGSGKTRVLVHKLASLLSMEDVKHENLLMLTFSRAAATEFKKRLFQLIQNAANFIEIKTFHSYCFDLLGRVGSIEKSEKIIQQTIKRIKNGEVVANRITKSVLVIDEAQDMDANEFDLIKALMKVNQEMRVVAVGDDDQNIYTFRGADSKYFAQFTRGKEAQKYELIENYRSKNNLVNFTNQFVKNIKQRFKSNEIVPIQFENGNITINSYRNNKLIVALVNDVICKDLSGTTGILTSTNDQALQITGLLLKNKIPAKLIQTNEGFNLSNLYEIRSFIADLKLDFDCTIISKNNWDNAKRIFSRKHGQSNNYELCKNLLVDFQETHPKVKYKSDFEVFIAESQPEDFILQQGEIINVSTIHKAKGKEFDNVFIILTDMKIQDDDVKRQIYVAMTRAKQNLYIHYNGNYLADIQVENLKHRHIDTIQPEPNGLIYHLSHKDIQLGYFDYIQGRIDLLISGETLVTGEKGLSNSNKQLIVKFSKAFEIVKSGLEKQGYQLIDAKVNFVLYWSIVDEQTDHCKQIKIVLPELYFEKIQLLN